MKHILVVAFAVASSMAVAETTWYLDKTGMSGMFGKEPVMHLKYWRNAMTGALCSPDRAPTADDVLIVTNAMNNLNNGLRIGHSSGLSVPCKSLQIGLPGGGQWSDGLISHDNYIVTIGGDGLILANGRYGVNNSGSLGIRGPVTVLAPNTAPFVISFQQRQYEGTFTVYDKVTGAEGTGIKVSFSSSSMLPGRNCVYRFNDLSGYKGDMTIEGEQNYTNVTQMAGVDSPGTLSVSGYQTGFGTLPAGGTVSFGTVDVTAASPILWVGGASNFCGKVVAKNAFTLKSGVKVRVRVDFTPTIASAPVLVAPDTATFTESDFVLEKTANCISEDMKLEVRSDSVAQTRSLCIVQTPILRQSAKYSNEGSRDNSATALSSLTNATHWSDGLVPHENAIYRTQLSLRTILGVPCEFPGSALWIEGGNLVLASKLMTVPELRTSGNVSIIGSQGVSGLLRLASRFQFGPGRVSVQAYDSQTILLDGDISGSADLKLEGTVLITGAPKGSYELRGDNSGFTGTIVVDQTERRAGNIDFARLYPTLFVNDGKNLGGALPSFDPRALKLTHFARLSVTNGSANVKLADGLNRGVYIHCVGRFNAEETSVIDVEQPLLLSGKMWKEGAGTLILRRGLKHEATDDGALTDVPRASSNLFEIAAGTVTVAHADALAGVETTVDKGAALKIAYTSFDDDLAKSGIRNTSVDAPFALDASFGGKLPLVFDVSALDAPTGAETVTNGILTVNDTAAPAVRAMLNARYRLWPKISSRRVEIHDAETSTTTFALESTRAGLAIILR